MQFLLRISQADVSKWIFLGPTQTHQFRISKDSVRKSMFLTGTLGTSWTFTHLNLFISKIIGKYLHVEQYHINHQCQD